MKKFKIFILNKITGLFFLFIFCFCSISLLSRSTNDPYFGNFTTNQKINNLFGSIGSYFAGTSYTFIGISSFFIPIFFLIFGFKKTFGIKTNYLLIHLVSFLLGIIFASTIFNLWLLNGGILGEFFIKILNNEFEYIFLINKFVFILIFLCVHVLALHLLFFGLSINYKIIKIIISPIFMIIFFITKLFRLNYLLNSLKTLNNITSLLRKKTNYKLKKEEKDLYFRKKTRKEPTIEKNEMKIASHIKLDNKFYLPKNDTNEYALPPVSLLRNSINKNDYPKEIEKQNQTNAIKLESVLKDYGVTGKIINFKTGPVITLFEFQPSAGIKTSKVIGLSTDIARSMSSMSARISSQPGKNSIGIEIPNDKRQNVYLGDLIKDDKYELGQKGLILALGKSISGDKFYTDLERMPHLLIAGTTGSGKSVGLNAMLISLLYRFKPSECKFILIDPKMLELSIYENIPHLLTPVVTDPKKAIFALKWIVREMENRYRKMNIAGVKNIQSFNNKISNYSLSGKKLFREVQTGFDQQTKMPIIEKQEMPLEHMPLIVVIIDEMADLMMVAGKDVEHSIQRLAQMARASGIHLIAATQRPSVDVITGTIKANFPSRISYRVASKFDSRTILNEMGAEQLLGSGDMLFLNNGANLLRLHGGYISEKEIENIVRFINSQSTHEIQKDITSEIMANNNELNFDEKGGVFDELYHQAVSIIIQNQKASTSFLQRHLQIGYNRAARIIEQMEKEGIITEANHAGKRNVLKKNV